MEARKFGTAALVLIGLITASFVVAEMEDGLNIGSAYAAPMGGTTLYVGGSGAGNYTHIQDAINDASSGDTVFVFNGTYYGNVIINKSINLVGEDKNTIINGMNAGDVVNITANGIKIQGFTIRNCGSGWPNAGVKIYYASNNEIYNCNISNNYVGIYAYYSDNNSIYNCNISNNYVGIYAYYSDNNSIYNCNITSNNRYGTLIFSSYNNSICNCNIMNGGIGLWYSYNNSICNCNIMNGGIELDGSYNNSICNCNITNGGIGLWYSYTNSIYNCDFINGGISIWGYELSHFIHNIYNNTVNGKPLLYYKNEENIVIDGIEIGEIIVANCSNFEIRNINISNTYFRMEIVYSNKIKIYNCNIMNGGIELDGSYNNSIYNCNIMNGGIEWWHRA